MAWYDNLFAWLEPYISGQRYKSEWSMCELAREKDQDTIMNLQSTIVSLSDEVTKYKDLYADKSNQLKVLSERYSPSDVNDKTYWDTKWSQNKVYYSAPKRKYVIDYVAYEQSPEILKIADQIIEKNHLTAGKHDLVIRAVMEWRDDILFGEMGFKYTSEQKETWKHPLETLKSLKGDCDDVGILLYFIIREIFIELGQWEIISHRIKCVAGNVNRPGSIPAPAGGHFYLVWLHSDSQWYVCESTYYREQSLRKFGELPQGADSMYGTIWFSFTEYASWSEHSLVVTKNDFKKIKYD